MSVPRFDWEEYLDLAEELVRRRGNPAAERSAISRAYYAAFHQASDHFASQGQRLSLTGDDHRLVWDWYLRLGPGQPLQWIGSAGHRLRQARAAADYDPRPTPNLSTDAQRWVALARQILVALRTPV